MPIVLLLCRAVSCIPALQCTARPLEHPCSWGPAQRDASLLVPAAGQGWRFCTGSRSLKGLWAMKGQQGAASSHCPSKLVICHDELCPTARAAQGPLQAGYDSWSGAGRLEGNWQRAKSRLSKYVCMGEGKEEMLEGERQELDHDKRCRIFTFVLISDVPAHSVNLLVCVVISPNMAPAPDSYDVFLLIYSFIL